MPDLADLCRAAVDAGAELAGHVEAYAEESRRVSVRVRKGEVEALTSAESRGLGLRVVVDGRLGYAYGADPDEGEVRDLVRRAHEATAFAEADPGNVLPHIGPSDPLPGLFRRPQLDLPADRKVGVALEV